MHHNIQAMIEGSLKAEDKVFDPEATAHVGIDWQGFYTLPLFGYQSEIRDGVFERIAEAQEQANAVAAIPGLRTVWATQVADLSEEAVDLLSRRMFGKARYHGDFFTLHDRFVAHAEALTADVRPERGDITLRKIDCDATKDTGLVATLNTMGIETVALSGIYREVCVEATAKSLRKAGFNVLVVEAACVRQDHVKSPVPA